MQKFVEQYGSKRVKRYPGQWEDEEQFDLVYQFLTSLGWEYKNEIFYKLPYKDEEGNFNLTKGYKTKVKKVRKKRVEKKERREYTRVKARNAHYDTDVAHKMWKLRKQKFTYREIQEVYNVSYSAVYNWIRRYAKENNKY